MNNNIRGEDLLTPGEVADILKASKATAYALLSSGEVPTVRIGSLVRVRRGDLERYLRDRTELKNRTKKRPNSTVETKE
jgi:excisionase family DNA binding protein